jgi:hypothetical protein
MLCSKHLRQLQGPAFTVFNFRIHAPFVASSVLRRNSANCVAGKNVARQFGQIRKSSEFISIRTGSDFEQKEQSIALYLYA